MLAPRQQELCGALADLLAYPREGIAAAAARACGLASQTAAAAPLVRFAAHAVATDLGSLQELYTATFDLQPACSPYFGQQLVGDSPIRGPLLARLVQVYENAGYRVRQELPDHVCEVLGFLAVARPGPERDDLLQDGLLPALGKMIGALEQGQNPYRDLLVAVREVLAPALEHPRLQEVGR